MEWMLMPYRRYADFSGRSARREYWMFTLLAAIVTTIGVVMMLAGGFNFSSNEFRSGDSGPSAIFFLGAAVLGLFWLGSFIPSLAVAVRRFHDRDMSGWWVLGFAVLGNIPYVGRLASLAQLVILALPGTKGPNRFGADPNDPLNVDVFS